MLVSLSGLPGAGKTTIAQELARQLRAVHLSIDTIERLTGDFRKAYQVALGIAADNLRLGSIVIADCVNPIPASRDAWRKVATEAGVPCLEVEVVCSDRTELERRLSQGEASGTDKTPRWKHVASGYEPWTRDRVVIDTAMQELAGCVATLRAAASQG